MHRLTILLIICVGSIASAAPQKPNIILLLVDDMGYANTLASIPNVENPNEAPSASFTTNISTTRQETASTERANTTITQSPVSGACSISLAIHMKTKISRVNTPTLSTISIKASVDGGMGSPSRINPLT